MKTLKNLWENELEKTVPELREDVKNTPIPVNGEITDNGGNTAALIRKKPFIITATAIFLALLCAIISCVLLLKPQKSDIFMFTVEINPAVCIVTDGNGKVTGVISVNVDADVILSSVDINENIIGKNQEDAITFYTDVAAKLGYLDLSSYGSAVRISAYGSGNTQNLLTKTDTALKNYFIGKGVYALVLSESVGKEEFAVRSGIPDGQSCEEMASYVNNRKTLYTDSEAEGLNLSELQTLYNNKIIKDGLVNIVEDSLKGNIEKLKKNAEDIQNLFELYQEIYKHADNPAMLLKDYWEVKKYYGDELTGEFALLVQEMDLALLGYEEDYGVSITCYADLLEAAKIYTSLSIEQLAAFLENFSFELFSKYSAELTEMLRIGGILSDDVLSLLQLPETVEEYFKKMQSAFSSEYSFRTQKYESVYNSTREPLSVEAYGNFISDIEKEYGSLENYWNNLKN